jgi:sRNA-binding regulator protein Hfq
MSPTESIEDKGLTKAIGKEIKLFLNNGKAITGKLVGFDRKSIELQHDVFVKRKDFTTWYPTNASHRKA